MIKNDKISIIVPVYNVENFLSKCLDSLINQTYKCLEIICVNDGSSDHSMEILEEYSNKDNRIKVISQNNMGLSDARNVGLFNSTGDYIMFVDSDDWIDLNTCEKALEENVDVVFWPYCREYRKKSLKTQYCGSKRVEWNSKTIVNLHRRMVGLTNEELRYPSQTDSLITAWGKLFKRCVLKDQFFVDTKYIGTEDALFNISVFFQVKSAVYIPDIYYHYRKDNSMSLTSCHYKKELVEKWRELYRRITVLLDKHNCDNNFYCALENRRALGVLQLGLGISSDKSMKYREKISELKNILFSPDYQIAIKKLSIKNMPFYWKIFFISVKNRWCLVMSIILKIMNYIRKRV